MILAGLTTFRDDGIIYGRLGRSPITRFGMRTLTFGVRALTFALRTLTFGAQMPSSVCERSRSECTPSSVCEHLRSLCERSRSECKRRVWSAIAAFGMQTLKNHFFSYQISQLFIQLQGNKVLIDLGGRFHRSIAACSNNRPPPSLG